MNLDVGTSGYSYPKWKGSFYPRKLPAQQMLPFYSEHFRTVEINYTFRRLPTGSVLETWAGAVPADFRFVLKAPEEITHVQRLMNAGAAVANFLEMAGKLRGRLGPLLFQSPPTLQKDAPRLRAFLALLPLERRVAFEFRHPSWFDDEVFGLLRDHGAALCIADADDGPEVPVVATTDWSCLRLRRPEYDNAALQVWNQSAVPASSGPSASGATLPVAAPTSPGAAASARPTTTSWPQPPRRRVGAPTPWPPARAPGRSAGRRQTCCARAPGSRPR
jgi:uncharacterized protein YecE (DUF72 family)